MSQVRTLCFNSKWVKKGKHVTPYRPPEGGGAQSSDLMAIHLNHGGASTLNSPELQTSDFVPTRLLELLESKEIQWATGLRVYSSQCDQQHCLPTFESGASPSSQKAQGSSDRPNARFRYIELFAGIGGFRLGLDAIGGQAVFASEIDIETRQTYLHNFGGMDVTSRCPSRANIHKHDFYPHIIEVNIRIACSKANPHPESRLPHTPRVVARSRSSPICLTYRWREAHASRRHYSGGH